MACVTGWPTECFPLENGYLWPPFNRPDDLFDLDETPALVDAMMRDGFTTFVLKPPQYMDNGAHTRTPRAAHAFPMRRARRMTPTFEKV
jgi:hypothetical protein